jgi:enolase
VEVDLVLADGSKGRASVPSGASTGTREALERRDGGRAFGGKGVTTVVATIVGEIAAALRGVEIPDQADLDRRLIALDGTENKGRCGANALLPVSMAWARATAASQGVSLFRSLGPGSRELPVPMFNVLNGGAHAATSVDMQEFMVAPVGASSFAEALQMGVEVYRALESLLHVEGYRTGVGDEGGFAPDLPSNERAIELVLEAIGRAGFRGFGSTAHGHGATRAPTSPRGGPPRRP